MKNMLYCKGCEYLKRFSSNCDESVKGCSIDHKFKADDKKEMWVQYSNSCPLKKYLGKADFKENPVIFS